MDTEETGRPSVPAAQLLRTDTDGRVRSARPTQFTLRLTPAGEDAGQRSGEGVTTASLVQRRSAPFSADDGLSLDFDQHGRIDEGSHLDHRRGRANRTERFAVGATDRFPVARDVHDVDPSADDICQ